ncbi:MAG: ATP-dependent metallopeptidase FtsH/Yme1/Tma family protein [Candidatus Moraniibacteriota bacterium]
MQKTTKNLSPWILVLFLCAGIALLYQVPEKKPENISLSELVSQINQGQVQSIVVEGNALTITKNDGVTAKASKENEASLTETLANYGTEKDKLAAVAITVKEPSGAAFWFATLLPFLLPVLIISVFLWFMFRQASRGNAQALSFGLSRARILDPKEKRKRITFKDVAGSEEAKLELEEVVDF